MRKIRVGVLGATGMVGQRLVSLLADHPWFELAGLAASPQSAGKPYEEAVSGRWKLDVPIPDSIRHLHVRAVEADLDTIAEEVGVLFSALDLSKDRVMDVEALYAQAGVAVISNNSAHRWTDDVPMIMPEINPDHAALIGAQRADRGWRGFIVVKPNCSLQSYLPVVHALREFRPTTVAVTTLQAVSGAGATLDDWPEMRDNVIPFIDGEEEKTEREPLKVLGRLHDGRLELARGPLISATCLRVPVSDGHMASVSMKFQRKPSRAQIKDAIEQFPNPLAGLSLPSAPSPFITYFEEADRPQTRLDRGLANGMGVSCGRFREDPLFDWKCVALAHNTVRGAAGGAILIGELLVSKGYIRS